MIAAIADYQATPITGYLQATDIYYVPGQRDGSFIRFDTQRDEGVTDENAVAHVRAVAAKRQQPALVLTWQPFDPALIHAQGLSEITRIAAGIVPDEEYTIYAMPLPSPATAAGAGSR